jgi:membrane protease YdiL (CAAX protease family)
MASIDIGQTSIYIPKGLLQMVAQFGPSLAGLIVIFRERGKHGIINLLKNITGFNFHIKWFVFALLFELLLFHLILFFCDISGYGNSKIQWNLIFISYFNFLLNTLTLSILTGLGEEIGWRGYLLPELQSKYKIIIAALVLSFVNSTWHLRSDCIASILQNDLLEFSQVYFPDMGIRIMITIPVIFVQIYIFNASKGNLFLMILFHGAANASYEWVKEMTGNPAPEFLLPVFAVILWISAIYFLPAIILQAKNKKLITQIY